MDDPRPGPAAGAAARPHPALRSYLAGYSGYRITMPAPGTHRGLPSGALTVILALDEPLLVGWPGGPQSGFWTVASGLHTGPAQVRYDRLQHGIQLAVTPRGARALLGMPAGELAGQLVTLDDLLPGSEDARARVSGCATWPERFAVLDRLLLAALPDEEPRPRPEVAEAWRRIRRSGGRVAVGAVASEVGWSRRHLAEQFRRELGLTPKEAAKVTRFERTCRLLRLPARPSLASAATTSGYADQAHLTRDWRQLAGCSPTTWLREELPFVQDRPGGAVPA